jgi:hypothetical protein
MFEWLIEIGAREWVAWGVAAVSPLSAWYITGREKRRLAKEASIATIATLGTKVDIFTELLKETRSENKTLADRAREQLENASRNNAHLTKQAVSQAKAAYKEANTVNQKIEKIGLAVKDGSRLNTMEPEYTKKPRKRVVTVKDKKK